MSLEIVEITSPIGKLVLAFREEMLTGLAFEDGWGKVRDHLNRRFAEPRFRKGKGNPEVVENLRAYMKGKLETLSSIPADPGGTPFQADVWMQLRKIPIGSTVSYGELARAIGRPQAVRAVGAANGANPISIVIPCHRVIAANGDLWGYGGGLDRKRWLLGHEGAVPAESRMYPETHSALHV